MSRRYRLLADRRLDRLVADLMGDGAGHVEAFLAANRGLAAGGPIVTEGTVVEVPDPPAVEPASYARAWE